MKKIIFTLITCFLLFGCSKTEKESNNSIIETEKSNGTEIESNSNIDVNIVPGKYYRINSTEGLRVRESNSLTSYIINKYPDNFLVYVEEADKNPVEIDKITSVWVKIHHNNDKSGWVFGGYLKPLEKFPENSLDVNEYRYREYKSSYNDLKPSLLNNDWEYFYIFSKDYVGEPQQFSLDAYDMYTNIIYDEYKIFTGLYKDKESNEGYFIAKTDLQEKKLLELYSEESTSHLIVFLKPWNSEPEYISVGRWFNSEADFYISKNKISEKLYWKDE